MESPKIQSYQDLKAWQEAVNLAETCYRLTRVFPKEELYGMTSQIRRASVSIAANIAEGYGRKSRGEYIQFLYISQGSLKELETHWLISQKVELVSADVANNVLNQCELVGKLLRALIYALNKK